MSERGAVLVTGASSGIGAATAARLSSGGFRVFAGHRGEEVAERLAGLGATPIRLDVTDPESVTSARENIEGEVGRSGLVGLVNNAGIPGAGPVERTPMDEYRRTMEVNFFGVLSVTQGFLPLVRTARGRIVMMSSLSGVVSTPFLSPYTTTKFALEALADSLRREVAGLAVDVIVIEPGPVATPIWDRIEDMDPDPYSGTPYEEALARRRRDALAAGRSGLPPELVAAAVERALTARRPPVRIVVSRGRWKVRLVRALPARVVDRLLVGRADRRRARPA